ncbi:hypothetical protein ISCGN_011450 [Ixodes scapularis]
MRPPRKRNPKSLVDYHSRIFHGSEGVPSDVFTATASSERNFDYDDDELDHEESLLWETSDTTSMGPTRPPSNKPPVEGVLNVDPHLHRQISEIVRSVMAEYTQKNPMPGGIWVSTKPLIPEPHGGLYQNPCAPARLQIPMVPWKMDNNHVKESSLPPQSFYSKQQQQQWRTLPMFPLPALQLPVKNNYVHPPPGVKTSFSVSSSHPVPVPKQEIHSPPFAREWRSQSSQQTAEPMEQRVNAPATVPPPIRPPKLAPLRFRQSQQRLQEASNLRSAAASPLKVPASVAKPAAPPSDTYYPSQAARPRKLVKQVFFTNRKPATAATSKTGQWYKMPVEEEERGANAAGEDRKAYKKQEDRAAARARKQEQLKKDEEKEASQFHYIHIVDRK